MSWTKQFSKSQNKDYWFNKTTGESSWNDPYEKKETSNKWKKHFSNKFQKDYWFNSITGESSWKDPNELETNSNEVENEEKLESSIPKKSLLSPEPVTDSRKLRNDKMRRRLIDRVRRKKKEAELKESKKSDKSSNVEDLTNKIDNLKIEKKQENEKSIVQPLKSEVQTKKSEIKPKKSYSSNLDNDSEFKDYDIVNGNGIFHTIRARDRYDAMEQMRDIAQSLNPYD